MRGITEERLRELREEHRDSPGIKWFIDKTLRDECNELNPLQELPEDPK